jgi:hypothetical protein
LLGEPESTSLRTINESAAMGVVALRESERIERDAEAGLAENS